MYKEITDKPDPDTNKSLLCNSKKMLDIILNASDIGLWDINLLTDNVIYSDSFFKLTGHKNLGPDINSLYGIIHSEDKRHIKTIYRKTKQSREGSIETEFRLKTVNGRYIWVLFRGMVFSRNKDKYPIRIIASIININNIKQDQLHLKIIHELALNLPDCSSIKEAFDLILSSLMELEEIDAGGAYIIDKNTGDIKLISHKGLSEYFIKRVMSYDKDSKNASILQKKPVYTLHSSICTDKTRLSEGLKAIALIPIIFHDRIVSVLNIASRHYQSFSQRTKNLLENISVQMGSILAAIISKEDIEASYSILKATLESTGDGIIVVSHEGQIKAYNNNFINMWNIPRNIIDSNSIKTITEYIATQVKNEDVFYEHIKNIKSDEANESYDIIELKDSRFFERYSQPHILNNKIIGRVWNYRDITQRKLSEKQQEELKLQLMHAQKMESLGRLSASIAHDLNNLLAPILGFSELLLNKVPETDKTHKSLYVIHNSAIRAKDLTQRLLTLGKKQNPEIRTIDLNTVITSFLPIIQNSIKDPIKVSLELDNDLRPIKADIAQIEHIILNLVINARDAIKDTGTITIKTKNLDNKYANISFIDTGCGIDDKVMERLFEPFFTTKKSGSGLGLTIVYNIIIQHNGIISIDSKKNRGTEFSISFPCTDEKIDDLSFLHETEDLYGNETILLVEDNNNIRELVDQILNQYEYKVISASRAKEALSIARAFPGKIDLLFTDYIMPDMTGWDLYNQAKQLKPNLKVLYMSGHDSQIIKDHNFNQNFIQKPFSILSAVKKVKDILQK